MQEGDKIIKKKTKKNKTKQIATKVSLAKRLGQ